MSTKQRPPIAIPNHINTPRPLIQRLSNGVDLYTLDCSDQDVVRVSFVFHAGTSTQSVPFTASSTANLLSEGSANFTAHQISEQLDFYGSYYSVSLDRDYVVITFATLSKFLNPTLDIAREILLYPAFSDSEIATYCSTRKQILAVERSKATFKSRELFLKTLFGSDHPYGSSSAESLYDSVTRADIVDLYDSKYSAENCFVVCSGKIGASEIEAISLLASDLPSKGELTTLDFPSVTSEPVAFLAHKGAVQSSIRIGRRLFPKTHPDFVAMQVVSTILGGYFGSRLIRNLREERGYTYGIFSALVNLQRDGYMAIATDVGSDVTLDSITQIFNEIARMRTELVGEDELQLVRNTIVGEVMRILDGPFGITDVTIENIQNGTDNSYLDLFLDEVRGITPEQILALAQRYFLPQDFTVVVVGSPALEKDCLQHIEAIVTSHGR